MAVTITTVLVGPNIEIYDVEATADADPRATVPHTLGAVPQEVTFMLIQGVPTIWSENATGRSQIAVVVDKDTGVGSGAAGNQLRVYIKRPHTMVR